MLDGLSNLQPENFFDFFAGALWIFLIGVGWATTFGGWILIGTAGYFLLSDPNRGQSPYKRVVMSFLGGIALLQTEELFRMISGWLVSSPDAGEMGDLDAWFAFGEIQSNETRDQLMDIFFNMAAVAGYTFFAIGVWRVGRVNQPDGRGQPILLSSALSSLFGGLILVYTPWLLTRLWN